MKARIEITFRGLVTDVVVDKYDDDIETNACEVEWHFDGLSPEDHNDLHISDEEDEEILRQIHVAMAGYL